MRFSEIFPLKGGSASSQTPPSNFPLFPKSKSSEAGKISTRTFEELKRDPFSRRIKPIEIYGQLILQTKDLLNGLAKKPLQLPDVEAICEVMDGLIRGLENNPSKILEFIERSTPEDYLPGHLANVAILAIAVSQKMGWSKELQRSIGVGALLHDAGETFNRPEEFSKSKLLSEEERKKLRVPPQECLEFLKGFLHSLNPDSRAAIERIILQCHERFSGQGYPHKLIGSQIAPEAQLVGLCHAYESLSHPRPYRPRRLSHEALRYIIELAGEAFDGNLLKKLWETLSLFPPGSFVKLNTGEICKVIEIREDQPIKPIVRVVITEAGARVKEERILDLAEAGNPSIEGAVDECALKLGDPALHLELKAQKWWMD